MYENNRRIDIEMSVCKYSAEGRNALMAAGDEPLYSLLVIEYNSRARTKFFKTNLDYDALMNEARQLAMDFDINTVSCISSNCVSRFSDEEKKSIEGIVARARSIRLVNGDMLESGD